MCKDGALSGKVALARENLEVVINEHIFIIRSENKILNLFLYYLLSTDNYQKALKNIVTGSAQGGINSANLKSLKIPLPPLDIQQKIVEELEKRENESEKLKKENEKLKEEIKKSIYQMENGKWKMENLGNIGEIRKGSSITKAKTQPGNIKVVAGGINFAYFHNKANRPKNTITISASGANAGFVNFWKEEIFASDCITINHKNDITIKYIYYFLKENQNKIFNLAKGAAQPHVYPNDIKSLKIPLPPLNIQKEIIKKIESIEEQINQNKEKIDHLNKEKEEILKREIF